MKTTVEKPKSWQRLINVEIPKESIDELFDSKLKKYKKDVKLPGFRPGKIPVALLKSRFGPSIRAEVIDELINNSYRDACSENSLIPISEPKISDLKAEEDSPITFKAEFEIDPEIELKGYKELNIKLSVEKPKAKDVDTVIEDLRERMAEVKDLDRASKKGDLISYDYLEVKIDGEPNEDMKPPQSAVEIGKGSLKDFDKGLIGLSADEEADLSIKFPADYKPEDVAGKTADLKIKVKKVQERIIPEVDEEFCKKAGNFADIDALKKAIKTDLDAQAKQKAVIDAQNRAIDAIIEKNDFEVPPSRLEYYFDKMIEEQAKYSPADKKPNREDIAKNFNESGIKALKRYRIIDYIMNAEKVKAAQEDVDKKIQAIADQYQQPFDEMKKMLRKDGATLRLREEIKEQKVLDMLIGEVKWEDK